MTLSVSDNDEVEEIDDDEDVFEDDEEDTYDGGIEETEPEFELTASQKEDLEEPWSQQR